LGFMMVGSGCSSWYFSKNEKWTKN